MRERERETGVTLSPPRSYFINWVVLISGTPSQKGKKDWLVWGDGTGGKDGGDRQTDRADGQTDEDRDREYDRQVPT